MTLATPPIVKLAFGLLRDIELAVSKFPRCHRYGVGEDLRRAAREVLRVANRAWRDKPQQALAAWKSEHIAGGTARATPAQFRHVRSLWASYQGHIGRADAWRLQQRVLAKEPWLQSVAGTPRRFSYQLEGKHVSIRVRK